MSINWTKMKLEGLDRKEAKSYYYWNARVKKCMVDKPHLTFDWEKDSEETLRNKLISLYKYNVKIGKCKWDLR